MTDHSRPQTANPTGRRLLTNYVMLASGEVFSKLLAFAAFTHMGRMYGADAYGQLELILAIMMFFTLPIESGLCVYGAREVAKDRGSASTLLRDVATLRFLLASISFVILSILGFLLSGESDLRMLMIFYASSLLITPLMLEWFFQGNDKMHWVAVISTVRRSTFAVLVFVLIRPQTPVFWIGLIECFAVLMAALVGLSVLACRFRLELPRVRFSAGALRARIHASVPIGLSELIWAVLWYLPMVQLGLLVGGEQLGWFGASHRIVTAVHTFVWLHLFNILPSISRCADAPRHQLQRLLRRSLMLCAWGSVFVALVTMLVSGRLMTTAFGDEFTGGGRLLSTLIWLIPIALIGGHFRYTLIAYNLQRRDLTAMIIAAVVGVSLGFVLTLLFGAMGTACSLIVATLVQYGMEYYFVSRLIDRIALVRHVAMPLIAAVGAFAVSRWLDADSLLAIVVAVGLYGVVFLLCQSREILTLVTHELGFRPTNVDHHNGVQAVSSDGSDSNSL